jgi:hypothetical protein
MEWAKTSTHARFNLATSGVESVLMSDFPVHIGDLEITGPAGYGYDELRRRLAAKTAAPVECIAQASGTSMANFLAMSACLEPGDEVGKKNNVHL